MDKGMSIVTFERLYVLNESTIRLVEKHKDETRESAKASVPSSTKIPCGSRRKRGKHLMCVAER